MQEGALALGVFLIGSGGLFFTAAIGLMSFGIAVECQPGPGNGLGLFFGCIASGISAGIGTVFLIPGIITYSINKVKIKKRTTKKRLNIKLDIIISANAIQFRF